MAGLHFLLSNPPHGDVDTVEAARVFGLSAAEARIKINGPLAEVWLAGEDDELIEAAARLATLGASVRVVAARAVAALSTRHALGRFAFGPDGFHCVTARSEFVVPYSSRVTVVVCRPVRMEKVQRMTLRQAAKAANPNKSFRQQAKARVSGIHGPADESFVDLYVETDGGVLRLGIEPGGAGGTDFSGLGEAMKPVVRENVQTLISMLRDRFAQVREDHRLEDAPPLSLSILGVKTLRGHLESLDPALKEADDYDLRSRFSFLALGTGDPFPS